jgi:hypothetical protein
MEKALAVAREVSEKGSLEDTRVRHRPVGTAPLEADR